MEELKHLYKTSKEKTDVSLLNKLAATASDNYEPPPKKLKKIPTKKETIAVKAEKNSIKTGTLNKFFTKFSTATNKVEREPKSEDEKTIKKEDFDNDLEYLDDTNKNQDIIDEKTHLRVLPEDPLPDAFINKRIGFYPDFISIPEKERRYFERHWIAYGGTVVKAIKAMDVDYVVHNNDSIDFKKMKKLKNKLPTGVRHVTKSWLIKCINNVELCETINYAVLVEP